MPAASMAAGKSTDTRTLSADKGAAAREVSVMFKTAHGEAGRAPESAPFPRVFPDPSSAATNLTLARDRTLHTREIMTKRRWGESVQVKGLLAGECEMHPHPVLANGPSL